MGVKGWSKGGSRGGYGGAGLHGAGSMGGSGWGGSTKRPPVIEHLCDAGLELLDPRGELEEVGFELGLLHVEGVVAALL